MMDRVGLKLLESLQRPMEANACSKKDLISGLPDEILTQILSYIPTQSAVATSLLSKRWNRVWISVPNLDFDNYSFSGSPDCTVKGAIFENFVDKVLSLNNVVSVRQVNLPCLYDTEISRVNAWIANIARRDVREIDLTLLSTFRTPLPDCFFNQKNLVELKITSAVLIIPKLVCFPSLKTIHLESVEFVDDSLNNLMIGCPVLKNLCMTGDEFDDFEQNLIIRSSTLHTLELNAGSCSIGGNVIIDAPNLQKITLFDHLGGSYRIIDVSSLVRGYISIENADEELFQILNKISHVQQLILSHFVASSFIDYLPMFNNLIHLTLVWVPGDSWELMPCLFHCTPKLVTLRVEMSSDSYSPCAWSEPHEVPRCFMSCIETVEISYFKEGRQEMQMISYILKNAMVLKKLSINGFVKDLVLKNKVNRDLLALPRASAACQIEFECVVRDYGRFL